MCLTSCSVRIFCGRIKRPRDFLFFIHLTSGRYASSSPWPLNPLLNCLIHSLPVLFVSFEMSSFSIRETALMRSAVVASRKGSACQKPVQLCESGDVFDLPGDT